MRAPPLALVAAALLGAAACATAPLGRAGDAAEVGSALARQRPEADGPVNGTRAPMVFLAYRGGDGPELGAYDLSGSRLTWHVPGGLIGRIEVGRDVIVHAAKGGAAQETSGTSLVGRALRTGAILWRHAIADEQRLIGYAADGDAVYAVVRPFATTPAHVAGTVVALDAASGAVRWRHDLPVGDVGGPAARGGLVAVPMATQYVVLFDGASGQEVARILSTEQAATFVTALPEGIFFGSKGVFRASTGTARASRKSAGYTEAILPRFAHPTYHHDMYRPELIDYSAIDRNSVLWRAAPDGDGGGRMAFRDGLVFVRDFRFFFAIDAGSGALRWAHAEPTADAVASAHTGSTLVYLTADGELGALEARTGRRTYRARIPGATMVHGATFDAEGFRGDGVGTAGEVPASPPEPSLAQTLAAILWDTDRRFSELATYAIEQLGRLPGRAVTADLLRVVQTPTLSTRARQLAEAALAARTDEASTELLVEALKVHGDYAEDRRAAAVGAIARAALATHARPLAQALAEHLLLPETEPETTVQISRALAASGAVEVLPVLRDFICLYRGEPAFDADPAPLTAAADALLALGGPAERELLLFIAEEPRTVEPLRLFLQQTLVQMIPHPPMKTP